MKSSGHSDEKHKKYVFFLNFFLVKGKRESVNDVSGLKVGIFIDYRTKMADQDDDL